VSAALRVVLDTNAVLSALLFRAGVAGQLRMAWQREAIIPLTNTEAARELVRVLAYPKFRLSAQDRDELLADYLPYARVVAAPKRRPRVPTCRDPHDLKFLELAATGKASYLISGDRDLLSLAGQTRFQIVSPGDFLRQIA